MRTTKVPALILAWVVLLSSGCILKAPQDINHAPVSHYDGTPISLAEMEGAIRHAAALEDWKTVDVVGPGHLVATRYEDGPQQPADEWTATVDIYFTTTDYSIHYKSSTSLNAHAGVIAKHYQDMVADLAVRIDVVVGNKPYAPKD